MDAGEELAWVSVLVEKERRRNTGVEQDGTDEEQARRFPS